jgi:hypothetical protein
MLSMIPQSIKKIIAIHSNISCRVAGMQQTTPNKSDLRDQDELKQMLDEWLEVEFSHIDTRAICQLLFTYSN